MLQLIHVLDQAKKFAELGKDCHLQGYGSEGYIFANHVVCLSIFLFESSFFFSKKVAFLLDSVFFLGMMDLSTTMPRVLQICSVRMKRFAT